MAAAAAEAVSEVAVEDAEAAEDDTAVAEVAEAEGGWAEGRPPPPPPCPATGMARPRSGMRAHTRAGALRIFTANAAKRRLPCPTFSPFVRKNRL